MLQIMTLGELADALKELHDAEAEAKEASAKCGHYYAECNPLSWDRVEADESAAHARVAELRMQQIAIKEC